MKISDYQQDASRTLKPVKGLEPLNQPIENFFFGLIGEVGEFANLVKKKIGYGRKVTKEDLTIELGDILWYTSTLCTKFDLKLNTVCIRALQRPSTTVPTSLKFDLFAISVNENQNQRVHPNSKNKNLVLLELVSELVKFSGEVVDKYVDYKALEDDDFNGKLIFRALGHVMVSLANICNELKINFNTVAEENIKKIKKRYPDGFSFDIANEKPNESKTDNYINLLTLKMSVFINAVVDFIPDEMLDQADQLVDLILFRPGSALKKTSIANFNVDELLVMEILNLAKKMPDNTVNQLLQITEESNTVTNKLSEALLLVEKLAERTNEYLSISVYPDGECCLDRGTDHYTVDNDDVVLFSDSIDELITKLTNVLEKEDEYNKIWMPFKE